jgi:hypothetical protein
MQVGGIFYNYEQNSLKKTFFLANWEETSFFSFKIKDVLGKKFFIFF